jgi:hypothetical protein
MVMTKSEIPVPASQSRPSKGKQRISELGAGKQASNHFAWHLFDQGYRCGH